MLANLTGLFSGAGSSPSAGPGPWSRMFLLFRLLVARTRVDDRETPIPHRPLRVALPSRPWNLCRRAYLARNARSHRRRTDHPGCRRLAPRDLELRRAKMLDLAREGRRHRVRERQIHELPDSE